MSRAKSAAPAPEDQPKPAAGQQVPAPLPPPAAPLLPSMPIEKTAQDLMRQRRAIQDLMQEVLQPDVHFGASFPGDTKKNLLQPGADALIVAFGLTPRFSTEREDIHIEGEGVHREYTVTCTLFSRTGVELGSGIGSCSTMESKYRWRNDRRRCPECGKDAIIRGKPEFGGGWICFSRKDGCGAKWPAGAKEIEGQVVGKIPNPDIADTYNTVLKVGLKRSKVAAVILVTGCADMFSQDAEDHGVAGEQAGGAEARQDEARPASAPKSAAPAAGPTTPAAPPAEDLTARLKAAYETLGNIGGTGLAGKVWAHFKKDSERAARLKAMGDAIAAIAAIQKRLPAEQADKMLGQIINDREKPDDVVGILADLAKAVPAEAAAGSVDAPPF